MTNMDTWIDEYHKGSRFGLNGKVILREKSKYQEIIVIENDYYGKTLMLDGCWMTSLRDEKYYHECLVHPALSRIDKKSNVLIIGGALGNYLDRIMNGSVFDFIILHYNDFYFPAVFNIADASITIGAVIFITSYLINGNLNDYI